MSPSRWSTFETHLWRHRSRRLHRTLRGSTTAPRDSSGVLSNASQLGIDTSRVIIAGESGGGNLTLALGMKLLREGDIDLVSGLYAFCPYIAGEWPRPDLPSSTENNGILLDLHNNRGKWLYGIEAFESRDPLAWPGFATADDVKGLPPVVISVNECDPLRDEGIAFYRLLIANGVAARCRQSMGTMHGTEILPVLCPDISADAAPGRRGIRHGLMTLRGPSPLWAT